MQVLSLVFPPLLFFALPVTEAQAINFGTIIAFIAGLAVILWIMRPEMNQPPEKGAANGAEIFAWSLAGVFMAYLANTIAGIIEISLLGIEVGSENTKVI